MVNVFPLQLYFPEGVIAAQVLPRLLNEGLVVAGGLHKDIRGRFKPI
jgi:alanine-glyoxylate transaminase/serine-glyoxylate transaminase/serine-pyruvate transaminase